MTLIHTLDRKCIWGFSLVFIENSVRLVVDF